MCVLLATMADQFEQCDLCLRLIECHLCHLLQSGHGDTIAASLLYGIRMCRPTSNRMLLSLRNALETHSAALAAAQQQQAHAGAEALADMQQQQHPCAWRSLWWAAM